MFLLQKIENMTITDYMRNIAFINLIELNDSCQNTIFDGIQVAQAILEFSRTLPDVESIIPVATEVEQIQLFYRGEQPEKYLLLEQNSIENFVNGMYKFAEGYDHCFYFYGDTPLLDPAVTLKMVNNHYKYFADYSFADGYPYGLTPEIISTGCLKQLISLAKGETGPVKRDSLFTCIQKDINAFDIETEISPVDMRLKRISLSCDTKQNWLQMVQIVNNGGRNCNSITEMNDIIETYTRTLPSYIQLQITEQCRQSCSYCPYPIMNPDHLNSPGEMAREDVITLAQRIEAFSPDSVLSLSLWGDPSSHSQIGEILDDLLKRTELKILIETSGLGWEPLWENRKELIQSDRIDWIFSLDAVDPQLYSALRGKGQEQALKTVEQFLAINPGHTWVQSVRMNENEEDLEEFFRSWKEKTENVIIQKYDHFCGLLPERKVTDLSPVSRFPCWHLKREMSILVDGSVPLCREDTGKGSNFGNIHKQSLEDIWESLNSVYEKHLKQDYSGICNRCDEYYTYNF